MTLDEIVVTFGTILICLVAIVLTLLGYDDLGGPRRKKKPKAPEVGEG